MNARELNRFIKNDQQGHYDLDGVSFDGEAVVVSGGEVNSSLSFDKKPFIGKSKNQEFESVEKKTKVKPLLIFLTFIIGFLLFGYFAGFMEFRMFGDRLSNVEQPL